MRWVTRRAKGDGRPAATGIRDARRTARVRAGALSMLCMLGLLPCLSLLGPNRIVAPVPPAYADPAPPDDVLAIAAIAERVARRYRGRLIAGEIKPARGWERRRGATHVYDLRLLTPAGAVLRLILDAHTGAFLEVSGRGQIEARIGGDVE